ncbi:MAG: hypothetical protein JKX74_06065 [Flavobacteriales bacterium]|nr:hypothetical protein [Flavobacteriales bacterium]
MNLHINRPLATLTLCALSVLISPDNTSFAQASFSTTAGQTDFYNRGNSVRQTPDGGYIVAGRTVSFAGGGVQAYLVKTDAVGKTLWAKDYGDRGSEEAFSVQVTHDGGFVFTGYSNSINGKGDVYLVRTNAAGDTAWTRTYGGQGIDGGNSVAETKDHGFVIAGETYSYGHGTINAYLIRTNEKGDTLWTHVFGGNGIEQGNSVQETTDGGFIITGRTNSFGAGDYDVYLIRTDAAGKKLWMQTFGGTGSEEGRSVQQTKDGGFIITGYTMSYGQGGADVFLVRADKNGNQLWTRTYGGATDDFGKAAEETHDGGFVISGYTNSFGKGVQAYLIRTDKDGNKVWEYTYGDESDDFGNSVDQTNDGGFIIGGSTVRSSGGDTAEKVKNVYLIKTDASGK